MKQIVVIGGGLMGCSAAWQLARAGKKVTLIEKQGIEYDQGSSYGEARVTRSLGIENDIFTYLKETSVFETRTLIDLLNKWDDENHDISDIHADSPVTYIYDQSLRGEVDLLARDQSYQTAISIDEQRTIFGSEIPDKILIREFKEQSGTINPRELIRKLKRGIELCGGEIKHDSLVQKITRIEGQIKIEVINTKTADTESLTTAQVVMCSGPYTGQLLKNISPVFQELLSLKRLYLCFLQLDQNYWKTLSSADQARFKSFFPVANFDEDVYYSMIEKMTNGAPLIKVGGHMRRFPIVDSNDIWKDIIPETEKIWSKSETLKYLNGIGYTLENEQLQYVDGYSCVYTLTKSETPIVSPAIDESGDIIKEIIVVAGLSGIGAKGTLAYGRHAADYILGNNIEDPMYQEAKKAMGIDRLKGTHS